MNSKMETVCQICTRILNNSKHGFSFRKLLGQIRSEFKAGGIDLLVTTVRDKHLKEEVFYANGYYDPEDDREGVQHIELVITHNFPKDFKWYPKQSKDLLIQVFDTVVHELRHERQYRARHFQIGVERGTGHVDYLADPDEIDAYSITIAAELCRSLGKARALRYLHNSDTLSRFKLNGLFVAPSLGMYKGAFPNPNDPVVKRLLKKVYTRLKKVDIDCVFM